MPNGNETNVLVKHRLADKLPDALAAAVDEFDESVARSNEGRRGHVGAVAELQAVSDEVMRLVEMPDGLNRYRFGGKAELIAAWKGARNVAAEGRGAEAPAPPEGDVRPAA